MKHIWKQGRQDESTDETQIALVSEILRKGVICTDKGRIWKDAQITIVVEAGGDGSIPPDPQ
jgi:hypothetical protein